MGYAFKGTCYPTQPEAAAQLCQDVSYYGTNNSGQPVVHHCTGYTATQYTVSKQINTTTTNQTINLPTFQTCSYDGATLYGDYLYLSLLVLPTIWIVKKLLNIFDKPYTPAG